MVSTPVTGKNKARIGVIGAGWWATENHLPIIQKNPDAELVAVATIGQTELESVRSKFGFKFATEDYRDLLDKNELDGVIVSSPHIFHYEHAKAAIESGCHVLVEKPLTTNAVDARKLTDLAEKHNVTITVPYGWNFSRMAQLALHHMHSDVMGKLKHIVLHMATPTEDLFSGQGLAGTENHFFQPKASTWSDPEKAGGYGWGQLAHALGMLFLIVDDKPESIFAVTRTSPTGADLHDAAVIRFESGMVGTLSGAGTVTKQVPFQLDIRIYGTKGHLCFDIERGRERVDVETETGDSIRETIKYGEGDYTCEKPIDYFVEVCLGRMSENPASGIIGCRAVEVLDALYRSARSGKVEKI